MRDGIVIPVGTYSLCWYCRILIFYGGDELKINSVVLLLSPQINIIIVVNLHETCSNIVCIT